MRADDARQGNDIGRQFRVLVGPARGGGPAPRFRIPVVFIDAVVRREALLH
ncbi:MAG TPA: hypothetical protein VF174_02135 [Micromonosporaceae bacterium]